MRLSTENDTTEVSTSLDIGGASFAATGMNSKPVTNIACAPGTCKTFCWIENERNR